MDENQLKEIMGEVIDEAIVDYNKTYKTNYTITNLPIFLQEYLILFALISINGWKSEYEAYSDKSKSMIKDVFGDDYKDYKGIDATTEVQLATLQAEINSKEELERAIDELDSTRKTVIASGIAGSYLIVQNQLATADNRAWVGAITSRDERVREGHQRHDKKYWKNNSFYRPWNDYNCRCRYYYFRTTTQARKAGFRKL